MSAEDNGNKLENHITHKGVFEMDIDTGIAIAGIWLFPSAVAFSKKITAFGLVIFALVAIGMTLVIL